MTTRYTRRQLLKSAGLAGAVGLGTTGFPSILCAQAVPQIKVGTLAAGFSVMVNEYMMAKRFDLKHGVELVSSGSYTSVANYYNDLAAGTYEMAIGSWDTFTEMYNRGVPIKLVCTATTSHNIAIVSAKNGPRSLEELRGKSLAAVQSSGSYRLSRAVIKDFWNIELGKDVAVENVPSPAQAITMIMGDRTPAALSWDPSISLGLVRVPDMKEIFNLGAAYLEKMKEDLPNFTYAAQSSALRGKPDIVTKISNAYADCMAALVNDPSEAIALAAPKMKVEPQVLRMGFTSGRLKLQVLPMNQPAGRKVVKDAADYMAQNHAIEKSVDDGFFAT
jgi:NitT/TauT family transport system substrate-binding protein